MHSVDLLPDRIRTRTTIDPDTGCWNWSGKATKAGYGMVKIERSRNHVMVYRLVYELLVAPIPDGFVIDHLCRNKRCLRPDHLEPVTQAENIRRGTSGINEQRDRTHCPRGHELCGDNLYVQVRKGITHRSCRTCRIAASAKRRAS